MGNHRAARRGPRRTRSTDRGYVGKRSRVEPTALTPAVAHTTFAAAQAVEPVPVHPLGRVETAGRFGTEIRASDDTTQLPLIKAEPITTEGGKRKAVKHAGPRGPLFQFLPSAPIAIGAATLAVAVGGAVLSGPPQLAAVDEQPLAFANALTGNSGSDRVSDNDQRATPVSRGGQNRAQGDQAETDLTAAVEKQAEQRDAALGKLAQQAEQQAESLEANKWVFPTATVSLTARFGQYGLWSSYHTGTDFNGNSGDSIQAIAGGVVTEAGYDGAYGNKTVITLDDGTEIWYAHQTSMNVSVGDTVAAGDVIGTIGTTGNVTGSHLHVEVRPGGGDPVDPEAAMKANGLF